jgi:formate dehydrogenase major subunit
VRLGRGAATTFPGSLVHSNAILIEGSNMAECHPVAFRWVMQAKLKGAKIMHADPRFTRTTAVSDLHAPVRAGTDIAFLGGIINHVITSERWNQEPFFKEYVTTYTNAATIISEAFRDTEDEADGKPRGQFSGLGPYTEDAWGLNGFLAQYNPESWQYARRPIGDQGRTAATAQSGEQAVQSGQPGEDDRVPPGPPYDPLVRDLLPEGRVERDETLQDPRCVFQLLKKHFARYTPETVSAITGCSPERIVEVAETLLNNSGPDKTSAICYAVGWTQHTYGPQMIGAAATLQLLLGNLGRPGGGIVALRGHATIQGSTDIPTLYHSIHGYMPAPTVLKAHNTVAEYLKAETLPTGYWANTPKFFISYLKSMYGDAATAENDWGFAWHPRISGDHSHMPMIIAMEEGRVKGMFAVGQNPAVGGQNARYQRTALGKLDWLVVKDNFETETAAFWYKAPEVVDGTVKTEDIQTEVFFFPSAQVAEMDGTFTNTQRLIKFHHKAVDPPGDARSDIWFTYHLGTRLKALYAGSGEARDEGMRNLTWEYEPDPEEVAPWRIKDEPSALKILREINGYMTDSGAHLPGFAALQDDGSTTCASWIYSGIFPKPGIENLKAASRIPDAEGGGAANLQWGYAWPANRRIIYNRASARPDGTPWSEAKKWVFWDPDAVNETTGAAGMWTGADIPDFVVDKPPDAEANPDGIGLDALGGTDPFILKADGKGWLFTPTGLVDGPLPTHYEPVESPAKNILYPNQPNSPVLKAWQVEGNVAAAAEDPAYPYVLTTYRLTEHHLSGVMSRWLPWLAELQPELFVEISPELAGEKGIANTEIVRIMTPRGAITAKALVTARMRPMTVAGKTLHHVGLPWHWGYQGLVTGAVTNDLSLMVGDPNVSIHEAKAFVCNVEKV